MTDTMNNYKSLFINVDKFNEENMSYVKPILFYKVSRNMGIYYKKEIYLENSSSQDGSKKTNGKKTRHHKKQKIIVQSPKMLVPFGVKEFNNNGKKSFQLSISFNTMTNLYNEEEIKRFYFFIQKIDKVNEDTVNEYKKDWGLPIDLKYKKTLQKLTKEFPHHMNLNLPYDDKLGFLFHIYDDKVTKSTIDIIEKRSIVSVVMELTDLKFGNKEYRSNWTIMQIRKFKPYSPIQEFFMTGCFICDEDDPEDTAYAKLIEKYRTTLQTPINLPYIPQINPIQNQLSAPFTQKPAPTQSTNTFAPPTLLELSSAISQLKKATTVVKGLEGGKVLDDMPLVPPPSPPPIPSLHQSNTKDNANTRNKINIKDNTNVKDNVNTKNKINIKDKTKDNAKDKTNIKDNTKNKTNIKNNIKNKTNIDDNLENKTKTKDKSKINNKPSPESSHQSQKLPSKKNIKKK